MFAQAVLVQLVSAQSPEAKRRVEEATKPFRLAVELAPRDPDAYFQLSNAYQEAKFLRAGSQELQTAVALAPTQPEWRRQLGVMLLRVGSPAEAVLTQYHASLVLRPDHGETYFNLGNALRDTNQAGQEQAFTQAVSLLPVFSVAYLNLAAAHQKANRGEESLAVLQALLEFEPRTAASRLTDRLHAEGRHLEMTAVHIKAERVAREIGHPRLVEVAGSELSQWKE